MKPASFLTIDGPGGVGKSTITSAVVSRLRAESVPALETREPSDTPLGRLARNGTDDYRGMAMACLVAADRHQHLTHVVRPALRRGEVVVCDRYIASSLVLQGIDGLAPETVWKLNSHADRPDLAVILNARVDVLRARLKDRGAHSRYERENKSLQEWVGFQEAARFLEVVGVRVLRLDTAVEEPDALARRIVEAI
ncbi:dTMP kinase [Streptomyces synnematoformans]|uniref:Thymidylate kinase n=1 Tax=Streptomyces synnematoformans TaxID=415721 RepID=A0ABN2YZY0_9ACTN